MVKSDLILRNPLRQIAGERDEIIPEGGFGAVVSRAGIGKTAFVVQMALYSMLQHRNVLHVSLNDPIGKVTLWYDNIYQNLAKEYNVDQMTKIWQDIARHRLVMTFKVTGFNVPRLEERIADLTEQNIFVPSMLIVDGFPFAETATRQQLEELKVFAKKLQIPIWFTIHSHREEPPGPDGLPSPFSSVADLFDVAIELKPEGSEVRIKGIKGASDEGDAAGRLLLDPSTMLITDRDKNQGQ